MFPLPYISLIIFSIITLCAAVSPPKVDKSKMYQAGDKDKEGETGKGGMYGGGMYGGGMYGGGMYGGGMYGGGLYGGGMYGGGMYGGGGPMYGSGSPMYGGGMYGSGSPMYGGGGGMYGGSGPMYGGGSPMYGGNGPMYGGGSPMYGGGGYQNGMYQAGTLSFEEIGMECQAALSCSSLALQVVSEVKIKVDTKEFKTLQTKYLDMRKKGKFLSKHECETDYENCRYKAIKHIGKALDAKFNFNCTNPNMYTKGYSVCDIWDFFDIYLHCDAKGDKQLLPDDKLWMQDRCMSAKVYSDACHDQCEFDHEDIRRSPDLNCYPSCIKL